MQKYVTALLATIDERLDGLPRCGPGRVLYRDVQRNPDRCSACDERLDRCFNSLYRMQGAVPHEAFLPNRLGRKANVRSVPWEFPAIVALYASATQLV